MAERLFLDPIGYENELKYGYLWVGRDAKYGLEICIEQYVYRSAGLCSARGGANGPAA